MGSFPEPKADDQSLVIGVQTFTYAGGNLAMRVMTGPYAGSVRINP